MFHVFPIKKVAQDKYLCTIHNIPELLSEEDRQKGFSVDVVPAEPQVARDEMAVSYCDPGARTVWYEVEKKPVAVDQTEMISILFEQTKTADQRFRDLDPETTPLEQYKSAKVAQLEEWFDLEIAKGFSSAALGTAHTYPADVKAQTDMQLVIKRLEIAERQMAAAGADLTDPVNRPVFEYLTIDTGVLPHHLGQLEQVFADGVDAADVVLQRFRALREQVNAATTNAGVTAVQP